MRPTACPTQARLAAYDRGDIPEGDLEAISAHLEGCRVCEAAAAALDGQPDPMLDVLRGLESSAGLPATLRPGKPPPGEREWAGGDSPSRDVSRPVVPVRLGTYEVVAELGRGGMGVVYKAWHPGLKRFVALKVVREGADAGADDFIRFRREAEEAARLHHPNVVQVYEIGHQNGRPYLALEYVEGGSLDRHLAGRPQPALRAAALLATLAEAVDHAHQHGVVHRDLKPANILLQFGDRGGGDGPERPAIRDPYAATPKITDFGLAKRLDAGVGLTAANGVVGTPQYMAPEQAKGQEVSPAADVYSLGAILYEMLTGRPPFAGSTLAETLLQVVQQDPLPVQGVRPGVPRDLATVCMKCLRKEPARRYASAAALAADLRRVLEGRPILARPVGPAERAAKWVQRYPALACSIAASVLVTAVALVLLMRQWGEAEARAVAVAAAKNEVERLSAGVLLDQALGMCAGGEIDRGLLTLAHALEAAHQAGEADVERLARSNLAAWRPWLIRPRARFAHRSWVWTVAFSPDGRVAATAGDDGLVRLWETATGRAIGGPLRHEHPVWSVAFSPDSKTLLSGSGKMDGTAGEARLWEAATGEPMCPPLPHGAKVRAAVFRPGGRDFLTVCATGSQRWDVSTCRAIGAPLRNEKADTHLVAAYSYDGELIATGSGPADPFGEDGRPGRVRLWNADTGDPVGPPVHHSGQVLALAFSRDGLTLATGGHASEAVEDPKRQGRVEGEVHLVDLPSGRERGAPWRQRGPVRALAFSPDGGLLAVGIGTYEPTRGGKEWQGTGGEVRLCLASSGESLPRPGIHAAPVWALAFSPDGRLLLTGDGAGQARFYDVASGDLIGKPLGHEGTVQAVAFSLDGRLALTASAGGDHYAEGRLWETPALPRVRTLGSSPAPATPFSVRLLAFSPDGRRLLANSDARTARVWDVATALPTGPELSHPLARYSHSAAGDPEGTRWVTCTETGARLWDAADGRLVADFPTKAGIARAAFGSSRGDPVLLTGGSDGTLQFRRAADGAALGPPRKFEGEIVAAAFLPGGVATWVEKDGNGFRIWRGRPSEPPTLVWRHPLVTWGAASSPDARLVLTTGRDRKAHLWEVATGRPRSPALSHQGEIIQALAFSRDGEVFLTGGRDRAVRLWDTATGKSLGPPLMHRDMVAGATFDPAGRTVAVGSSLGGVRLWDLPTKLEGEPEQLREWAEGLTGLRRDATGAVRGIEDEASP